MSGSAIAVVKGLGSVEKAVSVSVTTTQPKPKAVYIGVSGDYYFELNSVSVLFKNLNGGSIIPIRPTKVATDTGLTSAVSAGVIVFLY